MAYGSLIRNYGNVFNVDDHTQTAKPPNRQTTGLPHVHPIQAAQPRVERGARHPLVLRLAGVIQFRNQPTKQPTNKPTHPIPPHPSPPHHNPTQPKQASRPASSHTNKQLHIATHFVHLLQPDDRCSLHSLPQLGRTAIPRG